MTFLRSRDLHNALSQCFAHADAKTRRKATTQSLVKYNDAAPVNDDGFWITSCYWTMLCYATPRYLTFQFLSNKIQCLYPKQSILIWILFRLLPFLLWLFDGNHFVSISFFNFFESLKMERIICHGFGSFLFVISLIPKFFSVLFSFRAGNL